MHESLAGAALRLAACAVLGTIAGQAHALPMGAPGESVARASAGLVVAAKGERPSIGTASGSPAGTPGPAPAPPRYDAVRAASTAGGMPAMRVLPGPMVGVAAGTGEALGMMAIRIVLADAALPRAGSHLDEVLYNVIATHQALSWEGNGPGLAAENSSLDLPESVAPGMAAAARRPGLLGAAVTGPRVGGMSESAGGAGDASRGESGKKAEPVLRSIRFGGRTVYIMRDESQANAPPE